MPFKALDDTWRKINHSWIRIKFTLQQACVLENFNKFKEACAGDFKLQAQCGFLSFFTNISIFEINYALNRSYSTIDFYLYEKTVPNL